MAASEAMLFKITGTQQKAQLTSLSGKTFTVGKVSSAGKAGMSKWMFLHPASKAAGTSSVALKIEGAGQVAKLSKLAGKTVTVGKSPATVGGAGSWLLLNPGSGEAAAAAAATAKGGSASQMLLVKAEGGRQAVDVAALSGKSYTVMKPPMLGGGGKAANWMFLKPTAGAGAAGKDIVAIKVQQGAGSKTAASMVGKTFTIGNAPMTAGAAGGHQWLAFKPVGASMASKAAATTVAFQGGANCPLTATPVAMQGNGAAAQAGKAGAGLAGKGTTAAAQTAKAAAGSGTIWKGTGLSLGLGLGLGGWGPLLLVGAAAFGVGVYGYMKNKPAEEAAAEGDMTDLTLEG